MNNNSPRKSKASTPIHKLLSLAVLLLCFINSMSTPSTTDKQCETGNQDSTCKNTNVGAIAANYVTSATKYKFSKKCGCQPYSRREKDGGARMAYLISLHNHRTLREIIVLLRRIVAPGFIILIHVDTKFPQDEWNHSDNELMKFIHDQDCNCCGATVVVESHFDCEWGKFSMLDPTLWAMEQLATNEKYKNKWDVFMNLSADSLPIFTPKVLSTVFSKELKGLNFVTSRSCFTGLLPTKIDQFPQRWSKREHYTDRDSFKYIITFSEYNEFNELTGRHNTIELKIHFGSQWMTLTPQAVKFFARSMNQTESLPNKLKDILIRRGMLMSDETFIPTVLAHHSDFRNTFPKLNDDGSLVVKSDMFHIRYERMDEHIPDANLKFVEKQRYEVPKSLESSIDTPNAWGPYYLGVYDLGDIKDSGALFMRKVAQELDPNLLYLFPVNHKDEIPYVQWPRELNISNRIEWEDYFKGKGA